MPRAATRSTKKLEALEKAGKWAIENKARPEFCGKGACGVYFVDGRAETSDARAAAWYQGREAYEVTEI